MPSLPLAAARPGHPAQFTSKMTTMREAPAVVAAYSGQHRPDSLGARPPVRDVGRARLHTPSQTSSRVDNTFNGWGGAGGGWRVAPLAAEVLGHDSALGTLYRTGRPGL